MKEKYRYAARCPRNSFSSASARAVKVFLLKVTAHVRALEKDNSRVRHSRGNGHSYEFRPFPLRLGATRLLFCTFPEAQPLRLELVSIKVRATAVASGRYKMSLAPSTDLLRWAATRIRMRTAHHRSVQAAKDLGLSLNGTSLGILLL